MHFHTHRVKKCVLHCRIIHSRYLNISISVLFKGVRLGWCYDLTLQRLWEDVRVPVRDICGGCIRDRAIMCHRGLGMLWILPSWEWVRCECSCLSGKLLMWPDLINLDDTFGFTGMGRRDAVLLGILSVPSLVFIWRATEEASFVFWVVCWFSGITEGFNVSSQKEKVCPSALLCVVLFFSWFSSKLPFILWKRHTQNSCYSD